MDNLILDTRLYGLEFLDDMLESQLQAMYAQCDVNGNEYLSLKCFVDVQKDPKAISIDEQKSVHNN